MSGDAKATVLVFFIVSLAIMGIVIGYNLIHPGVACDSLEVIGPDANGNHTICIPIHELDDIYGL